GGEHGLRARPGRAGGALRAQHAIQAHDPHHRQGRLAHARHRFPLSQGLGALEDCNRRYKGEFRMLVKMTVDDFIGQLASASPTPGGGSASALAGAMAAAMVEMVCNLTVGREKFRDVEGEMRTVLARARELREEMLAAVDEDTRSYNAVSEAYKLPRETDSQKAERSAAIQSALKRASEVPLT